MLRDTADNRVVGFTLVELLTVLAVMSLLMGILFPALHQARESARQLVCSSNLNQIGKAMGVYVADTTFYPAAYLYDDDTTEDPRILHWSGLFVQQGLLHEDVFGCPSLRCDGLPPSHTRDDNLEDGQVNVTPGLEDLQVDRCAYTVNETLLPRNRFTEGFEGACRVSRYVRAARLRGFIRYYFGHRMDRQLASVGSGRGLPELPAYTRFSGDRAHGGGSLRFEPSGFVL